MASEKLFENRLKNGLHQKEYMQPEHHKTEK